MIQYRADYARRDDRSIEQPLYPHGTRQRPAHEPHHPAPCAASRHAADCFFLRPGIRRWIITGSIVIENVFGIPGVGQLFVNGALNRDYGMILGLTILVAS